MTSNYTFIYDGECPFCNHFAELLEIKSKITNIKIIDGSPEAVLNDRKGSDLTSLLLFLCIVCFVLQSILAKIFTNKISKGETDVAASLQLSNVAAARRT